MKNDQLPKAGLVPLNVTGISAVTLGTFFWAIALLISLLAQNWLAETGRSHWTLIALSGVGLGLLGYRYTTNRARRLGLPIENPVISRLRKSKVEDQSKLIQDFE